MAKQVLFVCQFNADRSVKAQAFFSHHSKEDPEITADSAGIRPSSEQKPQAVTLALLRRFSGEAAAAAFASKTVSAELVEKADLVVAMDADVLQDLQTRFPQERERMALITDFGSNPEMPLSPLYPALVAHVRELPERGISPRAQTPTMAGAVMRMEINTGNREERGRKATRHQVRVA